MNWVRVVGNLELVAAAVAATWFVVRYHWLANWRTGPGRHVMAFGASIAVVLNLAILRLLIGDSLLFQAVRTVVFNSFLFVLVWRCVLLEKEQRAARSDEDGSAGRANEEPDDDADRAQEDGAAEQLHDPADDQAHRQHPQ